MNNSKHERSIFFKISYRQMMLCVIFLLPVYAIAQKVNDQWTTPVTDVRINENKISVSFSNEFEDRIHRIIPVEFDPTLIEFHRIFGVGYLLNEEFEQLNQQLDDYLADWNIGQAAQRDKEIFLQVCVVKIIWNSNNNNCLSENSKTILKQLPNDLSVEISNQAKLVLKLYDDYFKR